jgi:competence ComEA-like helix-hairpin-helix protein
MKSHFSFNKKERSGIFFLVLLIILLQVTYFFIKWNSPKRNSKFTLNTKAQAKIDSLKLRELAKDTVKIYSFNPNFTTDYKGYTLGMSIQEIDRLRAYRESGKYVNSAADFQTVTKVSDSLLAVISPYFKFPEWTQKLEKRTEVSIPEKKQKPAIRDLNIATADDLKQINGIGEKLSKRIVKFRNRLGGFLVNEQLYDVYGLESEVVERALKKFQILNPPKINKININTASADELTSLVYIQYDVAKKIVRYRQKNDAFKSFTELSTIEGFPKEKIERIKLYLSL